METTTAPTVPSVSPVYYKKEILSSAFIANGAAVQFQVLDGNIGVLALVPGIDDPLIAALNKAATAHVGGILKIDEATYAELKKNRPFNPSAVRRNDMLQIMQSAAAPMFKPRLEEPVNAAPVAEAKPFPQRSPTAPLPLVGDKPAFKPNIKRASDIKTISSPAPTE